MPVGRLIQTLALHIKAGFALKSFVQGGRFEYNKRYKQSKNVIQNFVHEHQKLPQNPKTVGKLDLIGQKKRFI